MNTTILTVGLADRAYDICIGSSLLDACPLPDSIRPVHAIVITDETVAQLYLDRTVTALEKSFSRIATLKVPAGESSKSVAVCESLWQQMISHGADRNSVVVALGGGVPGDIAGFVAATFARGIRFIQIPTTLLAQVDSSVGGKTGINLPLAKNIVGAFWQPRAVIIDPDVLATLPDEQYQSGLAEVVKYGVIDDAELFEFLESNRDQIIRRDVEVMTEVIAWCCRIKARVVEEDEKETSGRRMILNYGHTYGHAVESVFGYGHYTHGAAIAMGMNAAARLAIELGICEPQLLSRQTQLLSGLGLPAGMPEQRHDEILAAMQRDKKVLDGTLNLILPEKLGSVAIVPAPDDETILRSFTS
ncbi:MAG: 3-dehydroquinate synthase [Planctomycetota bacterium]